MMKGNNVYTTNEECEVIDGGEKQTYQYSKYLLN